MGQEEDRRLENAEAELAEAETDLRRAENEEEQALERIERAEHEIEESKRHREAKVEFEDVNTLDTVDFRVPWSTKLTAAWDEAATKLEEPRKPDDRLQTTEGRDLMPYLELTVRELEERHIVSALKFQIVGKTGGA